jgi:hypothetical protein
MSDFSHAYVEGRDEGYQQAVSDLLEVARALLRAQSEYSGQTLVDKLAERFELEERKL